MVYKRTRSRSLKVKSPRYSGAKICRVVVWLASSSLTKHQSFYTIREQVAMRHGESFLLSENQFRGLVQSFCSFSFDQTELRLAD